MNNTIKNFVTNRLKELLAECTEGQQLMFKRMYSNGNLHEHINNVVDQMEDDKLDYALTQVERTIDKNNR